MRQDREKVFRNELRDGIERYRMRYRIMHGSIFQPGIPDGLIMDRKYGLTFVECKVDLRLDVPTRESVVAQLEGAQVVFVNDAWTLQAPRVFVASRHHSTQKIYVATFNAFYEYQNVNFFVGWLLK